MYPAVFSSQRAKFAPALALAAVLAVASGAAFAQSNTSIPRQTSPANPKKPNVLFIVSDDMGTRLGCYGDRYAKTPNIDNLARRGVTFQRAYCQFPLCNPSRASFMTGLRPETTQVFDNEKFFRQTQPLSRHITMAQMFKQNGYRSARVGKIFHYGVPVNIGSGGMDDFASWDIAINPRGRDKDEEDTIEAYAPGQGFGGRISGLAMSGTDDEQTDGIAVQESVKLMARFKKENKPFFLAVGFYRPHTPYVAPQKYFDLFPLADVNIAAPRPQDRQSVPAPAFTSVSNYGTSEENRKKAKRAYYAATAFMDAQLGRLLKALEELKLSDNTIIVFTGDHGYLLGEHDGQWQKTSLFEEAARIPMIVAVPGKAANGTKCVRLVEYIDLYPTLAELGGLTPPATLEGRSLLPLLQDVNAPHKPAAYTMVRRGGGAGGNPRFFGRSVCNERWRYTEWGENGTRGVELYDLENDPDTLNNLAGDAKHAKTVGEMKTLLNALPVQPQMLSN